MNFDHDCECDGDYGFGGMAAGDDARCANCPLRGHVARYQPESPARRREREYFARKKANEERVGREFNSYMIELFNEARRKP